MHKILLVEDETIVRVALKTLVEWEKYDFDMRLDASNGRQALDIIHKNPDIEIIITDINMPVMDGLALIKEIKKLDNIPEIIVLSAYDDYDLVRKAFKLGIYDYILKIEMEPEKVLNLLKKVIEEKEKYIIEETSSNYTQHDRNIFLKSLFEESDQSELNEQLIKKYGIRLNKENITLCYIWVDNYRNIEERYENSSLKAFTKGMVETISHILDSMDIGEVVCLTPDAYILLLSFQTNSELAIRQKIDEILKRVRHGLLHYLNIDISVGISKSKHGYSSIASLYLEAHSNAKLRFILGKGKDIYSEEIQYIKQCDRESIIGKETPLLQAFESLDKDKVILQLDQLLDLIGMFKGDAIEEVYGYYMELIFILIHYLNKIEEDTNNIFEHNTDFHSIIRTFDTKQEIHQWIRNLVSNLIEYLIHKNKNKNHHVINKAQKFIEENYMKKLTLLEVSEYTGLSEGYFSKLFTQETGESFIQYLTQIRINKAKVLLKQSNMKVYEICDKIGYENVEHFSRMFKRMEGISPKQFKKGI